MLALQARVAVVITMPRSEIVALCERLGHDPDLVTRITILPKWVHVEYAHPVSGNIATVSAKIEEDRS